MAFFKMALSNLDSIFKSVIKLEDDEKRSDCRKLPQELFGEDQSHLDSGLPQMMLVPDKYPFLVV